MARTAPFVSRRTIHGKCVIHGLPIGEDEKCPDCRKFDQLTEGDYLLFYGRPADGAQGETRQR